MNRPQQTLIISPETIPLPNVRHTTVYSAEGIFAGWPFNNGFEQYSNGNELVVAYLSSSGGPTQLVTLADGRILAIYGYREAPYGIRARLSEYTEAWHWGPELIRQPPPVGHPPAVYHQPSGSHHPAP